MNIKNKILITDTNVITDLSNANILKKFIKLDNVYTSDMVKNDEINSKTGDVQIIKLFKTISSTSDQLIEIYRIKENEKSLSPADILNYILARDNNSILATGDKRLYEFASNNGVEVIRTLGIIKFMNDDNIITTSEAIDACNRLKKEKSTRIPEKEIDSMIAKLKKDSVSC